MVFSYWIKTSSKCQWDALFLKSLSTLPTFQKTPAISNKMYGRKFGELYWVFKASCLQYHKEISNYVTRVSEITA